MLTVNLQSTLHQVLPNCPISIDSLVTVGIHMLLKFPVFQKKHKKKAVSIHSHGCLCYPLHCNCANGHVWRQVGLFSLRECSNRPVTLTQFLKMQPPVEPTSLSAATFAGRTGRRRKKAEGKRERKGKDQSRTAWYYVHILWLKPKKFELSRMREEEETNKSRRCAAYISPAFQEHISPVCEQSTAL